MVCVDPQAYRWLSDNLWAIVMIDYGWGRQFRTVHCPNSVWMCIYRECVCLRRCWHCCFPFSRIIYLLSYILVIWISVLFSTAARSDYVYVIYFRSSNRINVDPHHIPSVHMWYRSLHRRFKLREVCQHVFEVYLRYSTYLCTNF
jgi:hypothetical protein